MMRLVLYESWPLLLGAALPMRAGRLASIEWSDWIHLDAIRVLVHHTSAVVTAVAMFALVGFVVQRLLHEGPIKRAVLWMDEIVLLCLFAYFAYELFTAL
ncbi:MAG: hypothetical protein WA005_08500 [Candidatus Binataceae bacterium]